MAKLPGIEFIADVPSFCACKDPNIISVHADCVRDIFALLPSSMFGA